mgnify:CR=1 FL=1
MERGRCLHNYNFIDWRKSNMDLKINGAIEATADVVKALNEATETLRW